MALVPVPVDPARTLTPSSVLRPPRKPVEQTAPTAFRPPFCPLPRSDDHRLDPARRYRYIRNGFYRRKCDRRRIQRFKYKRCQGGFSQQTFSVTSCMKRPDLLPWVANWLVSGASLRRLARSHNGLRPERRCHPSTVPRISRRIGSQCLLVLEELRACLHRIREPIASDPFETFAGLQQNALGVATAVGARSWFVDALEPAWHRSATTASRHRKRVATSPRAIERSVTRTLDTLLEHVPERGVLDLISDDDLHHARAVARHPRRHRIRHATYRNPADRKKGEPRNQATRRRDTALFPVDLLHKLQRNWLADDRRETIAFGKRGVAVIERLAVLAVFRNLIQRVSERRCDSTTPAMRLGLTDRPWRWHDVLAARRFPTRIRLGEAASRLFGRSMRDPRGISWPPHVRMRAL